MSRLPDRTIKGMFAQARQIARASRTHTAEALDRTMDEQEQTRLSTARDERDEDRDDDDRQALLDRLDDIVGRD